MLYFRKEKSKIAGLIVILVFLLLAWSCAQSKKTSKSLEKEESYPADLVRVNSIDTDEDNEHYHVVISGNKTPEFTSVKQPFPLSVVLYLQNTILEEVPPTIEVKGNIVDKISTSQIDSDGKASKIEILLKKDVAYQVSKELNGLRVLFRHSSETLSGVETSDSDLKDFSLKDSSPSIIEESFENGQPPPSYEMMKAPSVKSVSVSVKPAWMNQVDFHGGSGGKSTLIIGTTVPVGYHISRQSPTLLLLRLENTNIPWYRQRPLITTRFQSAVNRITPYQKKTMKSHSLVSIELREAVPFVAKQTGNIITVEFEASKIPPKPMEQAMLPDWKKILSEMEGTKTVDLSSMTGKSTTSPFDINPPQDANSNVENLAQSYQLDQKKVYTGEKVSLDFYQTDIKNVFRILREVSGKNFAIDKDVTGSVTLTLDKPVPWDQVLDLVLKMNQLGMVEDQNIIRIATLTTLKKEEDLTNAQIASLKKAHEQKKSLEPLITEYIPVNYSNATSEVLPHINNVITKERGSATVDLRNNQIIVTDTAEKINQMKQIVNRIDRVTPQVIIEARVIEVSNSFSKEIGVQWSTEFGPQGIENWSDVEGTGDMAMNFPAASSNVIGFSFARVAGVPWVLDAKISAIETNGQGRILSSPKILTLDNKKAKIKQGIEFPYLERDDAGGSSVKFKNVDLLLEVTPHVTPDERIAMKVFITKNDVSSFVQGIPSVATNEAETEFIVNDGDTIVIGGIIKATDTKGETGFPVLSKIPVIGWLFKTKNVKDEDNELLIFITPRIVQLEQKLS